MSYTQEDLEKLQAARMDLATGQSVTQVRTSNGKTLTFSPASRGLLEQMIAEAKRSLSPKLQTRTRMVITSKGL